MDKETVISFMGCVFIGLAFLCAGITMIVETYRFLAG